MEARNTSPIASLQEFRLADRSGVYSKIPKVPNSAGEQIPFSKTSSKIKSNVPPQLSLVKDKHASSNEFL